MYLTEKEARLGDCGALSSLQLCSAVAWVRPPLPWAALNNHRTICLLPQAHWIKQSKRGSQHPSLSTMSSTCGMCRQILLISTWPFLFHFYLALTALCEAIIWKVSTVSLIIKTSGLWSLHLKGGSVYVSLNTVCSLFEKTKLCFQLWTRYESQRLAALPPSEALTAQDV